MALCVSGSDVYVGGTYNISTFDTVRYTTATASYPGIGNRAVYWKNGVPTTLPSYNILQIYNDTDAYNYYADYISGICVSNNNVYVCGGSNYYNGSAEYWLNGVLTNLTIPNLTVSSSNYPHTAGIAVSDNNVYICGNLIINDTISNALYWKNGVMTYLSTDNSISTYATSICCSGSNVYISGYEIISDQAIPIIWKNGIATYLTTNYSGNAQANSVYVCGSDVYVAGYSSNNSQNLVATYWKDQIPYQISNQTYNSSASSIVVIPK
jgi:hypothetical protein